VATHGGVSRDSGEGKRRGLIGEFFFFFFFFYERGRDLIGCFGSIWFWCNKLMCHSMIGGHKGHGLYHYLIEVALA
jgi:hypothetical protein